MMNFIGMIIFFSLLKEFNKKFTNPRQLYGVIIGAFVLRNFGFLGFISNSGVGGMINGFLNIAVVMGVIKLISLKVKERNSENADTKTEIKPKKDHDILEESIELVSQVINDIKPTEPKKVYVPACSASSSSIDRELARKAVEEHLLRRGYKLDEDPSGKFDLIAKDSQKKESFVKYIAFTRDDKNNEISLTSEIYREALALGRNFLFFIVTETREDEDADYMGNYVKVYKMDSCIEDTGFQQQNTNYAVTLNKFKKNASDWETRIN